MSEKSAVLHSDFHDPEAEPLVSVIMPAYNSESSIGPAIESVLTQSYKRLELIVVDNGSTDRTLEISNSYRDVRVRPMEVSCQRVDGRPAEGVIAKARNHGVINAKGTVIAFLDSDDVWEPNKLRLQLGHLNDPAISCVASDFAPIGNTGRFVNHLHFKRGELFHDFSLSDMFLSNRVVTSSALVRTKDLCDIGMFDEDPRLFAIEDWDLWIRLARTGKIRVLADTLVRYTVPFGPKRNSIAVNSNTIALLKKYDDGSVAPKVMRAALASCYATIGRSYLEFRDQNGVRNYLKALRLGGAFKTRARCVWGLILFACPEKVRRRVLSSGYFLITAARRTLRAPSPAVRP